MLQTLSNMCLCIVIPVNDSTFIDTVRESRQRCSLFLRKCGERLAKFPSWPFSWRGKPERPYSYVDSHTSEPRSPPQVIYYPIFYTQFPHPPPYTSHVGQFTELSVSELNSDSDDSSDEGSDGGVDVSTGQASTLRAIDSDDSRVNR